jgi:2-amino-4-hydroxy-6-hydroxymethyldihydropteridine diphosphokinase
MNTPNTIYFSLGSNLGNRLHHLQQAINFMGSSVGKITRISPVYESPAWGFEAHAFLNCCLCLQSTAAPQELLEKILDVEIKMGRERTTEKGYQSRIIDIDMLYFNEEIIETDHLVIPHPHVHDRRFVLKPLADIAPQLYHPKIKKDTRNLLQECKDKGTVTKWGDVLYASREALFAELHFLAIEGNIGAGKTTLASKIAADFNAKLVLERFADNPFLPKFYKDQSRYAFPLEMSFLADRYQQFTDDTSQFDLFKNFMVSDYDIFKSLIFAKVTLQEEEFGLYRKVFDFMYKEVKKPDIYIYLYQNTHRLLDNIKKRGRSYEQQIAPDYLESINRGYLDFIKSYPQQKSIIIDVSELDFVDRKSDYEHILTQIQAEVLNTAKPL